MNTYRLLLCTAVLAANCVAHADTWSLDSCVNHAIDHNLTVQASRLQIMDGELSVTEAKDKFLPSVRAGASQGFSFGRGLTAQNTYADRNTSNFQWKIGRAHV